MSDRTDAEAAKQEALEEAGIEGVVSERPVASYRYTKLFDDGSTKPAQAIVFSLQVTDQHRKWDEGRQRRRRWVTPQKASEMVFEPDLGRLLAHLAAGRIVLG